MRRQPRSRPAKIVPGAESLERAARKLEPVASPDPFEALEDIRLGKELKGVLEPTFAVLGATLEDELLKDAFDQEACSNVTVARGTAILFYLISVPRFILSDHKKKNRNAIMGLKSLFRPDSRIFLFSENEPYLRYAYATMFQNEWAPEVTVQFVPWDFISDLEDAAEVQRPAMIKHVLGDDTFARPSPSLDLLADDDRQFLVEYMRDQAQLNEDYFKNLVTAMALPPEFRGETGTLWTGDLTVTAQRLLEWTFLKEWFPAGTERSDYTVAGALLEQLTHQMGGDKPKRVGQIVIAHGLIRDQQAISSMRERLALDD